MNRKQTIGLLVMLAVLGLSGVSLGLWLRSTSDESGDTAGKLDPAASAVGRSYLLPIVDMAADCRVEPSGENYIGVRYKALLVEDELSESDWTLLFAGSGFTSNGEYQPHFIDLMIKAGWANQYSDPLCSSVVSGSSDRFTIEFGLSDYEDSLYGWIDDNDIAAWTRDPWLFPRFFTNIDSSDPAAADKIMTEYQVDRGGALEGREIEVSLVRAEVTTLPQDQNYYMDPDLEGELLCSPNSQDDITYRHWIATLGIPSLGIERSVDFYIDSTQGDKLRGTETLNFMWETPGRPVIESDKYKVIIYEPEVKTTSGHWIKASRFLVDIRTSPDHLPLIDGELAAGYRKTTYNGLPAIEASFGYGYTDYVTDGDLYDYEPSTATMGVIELDYPTDVSGRVVQPNRQGFAGALVQTGSYSDVSDEQGVYEILDLEPGVHTLTPELEGYRFYPASREVILPPDATGQDFTVLTQPVSITLTPGVPASLSYTDTQGLITSLDFPADAVAETTTILLTPTLALGGGGFAFTGHAFELAAYQDGSVQPGLGLGSPAIMTIRYSDADLLLVSHEEQLAVWWQAGSEWQDAADTCTPASTYDRDLEQNVLTIPFCHLSLFGMFGPTHNIYMPIIFRYW